MFWMKRQVRAGIGMEIDEVGGHVSWPEGDIKRTDT